MHPDPSDWASFTKHNATANGLTASAALLFAMVLAKWDSDEGAFNTVVPIDEGAFNSR